MMYTVKCSQTGLGLFEGEVVKMEWIHRNAPSMYNIHVYSIVQNGFPRINGARINGV